MNGNVLTPAADLALSGLRDINPADAYVNSRGAALVWINEDEMLVIDPDGNVSELEVR